MRRQHDSIAWKLWAESLDTSFAVSQEGIYQTWNQPVNVHQAVFVRPTATQILLFIESMPPGLNRLIIKTRHGDSFTLIYTHMAARWIITLADARSHLCHIFRSDKCDRSLLSIGTMNLKMYKCVKTQNYARNEPFWARPWNADIPSCCATSCFISASCVGCRLRCILVSSAAATRRIVSRSRSCRCSSSRSWAASDAARSSYSRSNCCFSSVNSVSSRLCVYKKSTLCNRVPTPFNLATSFWIRNPDSVIRAEHTQMLL